MLFQPLDGVTSPRGYDRQLCFLDVAKQVPSIVDRGAVVVQTGPVKVSALEGVML